MATIPSSNSETIAHAMPTPLREADSQLLALLEKFRQTQYWPPERLWEHQRRHLGLIADHVYRTRPFYHARLAACGYRPGHEITAEFWQTLPILTRREVQEHFAAITDGPIPAEHLPCVWDSTSGSSGMPLKIKGTRHADDVAGRDLAGGALAPARLQRKTRRDQACRRRPPAGRQAPGHVASARCARLSHRARRAAR